MKRAWIVAALCLALLAGLCACAGQTEAPTEAPTEPPASEAPTQQTQEAPPEQTEPPTEPPTESPTEQTTVWDPASDERHGFSGYLIMPPNENVEVPFVAIPTGYGIEDINAEISEKFRDPYQLYKYVHYDWFTNGDILTLCITYWSDVPADAVQEEYMVYSISVSGCRPVSDEEVLAAAQMSYEDFQQAVVTASQNEAFRYLDDYYFEYYQDGEWQQGSFDSDMYDSLAEGTRALAERAQPYLAEDGKLWAKCLIQGIPSNFQLLLPLTDITLTPSYAQWLAEQ